MQFKPTVVLQIKILCFLLALQVLELINKDKLQLMERHLLILEKLWCLLLKLNKVLGLVLVALLSKLAKKGYAGAWGAEGKFKFSSSGISIGGGLAAKVGAGVFINIRW